MESNDSPEIPDRGETSDIPGLPSGVQIDKYPNSRSVNEASRLDGIEATNPHPVQPVFPVVWVNTEIVNTA